jgi:hypothetical protein
MNKNTQNQGQHYFTKLEKLLVGQGVTQTVTSATIMEVLR